MVECTSQHDGDPVSSEGQLPQGMAEDTDVPQHEELEEVDHASEGEVEIRGCSSICDPRMAGFRFSSLIFMCLLGFGSYFSYDSPASLQDQIKDDMHVNTVQFASLYSLYSWPNVILSFLGGFLIDRLFGIRIGTIVFSAIVTASQFVYALGAFVDRFWVMQLARFLFGVGGESLAVAQNTYAVSWFKGKELNAVFGLTLSMARVGSTVNFLAMGPIYKAGTAIGDGTTALGITALAAAGTCVLSLVCALILGLLDKRRSSVLHISEAETGEKVKLSDVLTFPFAFWLICVICVTYYVAIFPFISLAKVFFMRKFDFDEASANGVSSIVYIISAVASPLLGLLVDITGRNIFWIFFAVLVSLGCHVLLAFTFLNPFIAMSILGLAYSLLASSLWPMVSLVIPENQLGSAYGMMQSIQNLGLALINMLAGYIVDVNGYLILEMFYIIWLCVALVSTVVIWVVDNKGTGYLMMSPSQRKAYDVALEEVEGKEKEPVGHVNEVFEVKE
ncbi:major facilitator superfamily domain-containing protein 1-like isoform X1 [Macrobrachium rosenbergii]|uniref:major facilitator superfamily domain-containing protein 1-like isoform X1 n=1 Tax=Macrobrachium rosenbergii TaxID=79674 RepID=UPI0034D77A0D